MSQKYLLTDINLNYNNEEEKIKNFFTISNNTPRNYIKNYLSNNDSYKNNIILMNNQLKNISINKNYMSNLTKNNNNYSQNIYKNQIQNFNFIIKSFYINNYNNKINNYVNDTQLIEENIKLKEENSNLLKKLDLMNKNNNKDKEIENFYKEIKNLKEKIKYNEKKLKEIKKENEKILNNNIQLKMDNIILKKRKKIFENIKIENNTNLSFINHVRLNKIFKLLNSVKIKRNINFSIINNNYLESFFSNNNLNNNLSNISNINNNQENEKFFSNNTLPNFSYFKQNSYNLINNYKNFNYCNKKYKKKLFGKNNLNLQKKFKINYDNIHFNTENHTLESQNCFSSKEINNPYNLNDNLFIKKTIDNDNNFNIDNIINHNSFNNINNNKKNNNIFIKKKRTLSCSYHKIIEKKVTIPSFKYNLLTFSNINSFNNTNNNYSYSFNNNNNNNINILFKYNSLMNSIISFNLIDKKFSKKISPKFPIENYNEEESILLNYINGFYLLFNKSFIFYDDIQNKYYILPSPYENHFKGNLINYNNNIILISGKNTEKVELFDIKNNKWEYLKQLNEKRSEFNSLIINNKLYICFGYDYDNKKYINNIEFLDLNTKEEWIKINYNLNIKFHTIFNYYENNNNDIYILGGEIDNEINNNLIKIIINENNNNNKVFVLDNNNKEYFNAKFKEISYEFFDKENNINYKCIMDIKGDVHLINPLNNKHIMYSILNKDNNINNNNINNNDNNNNK